MTDTVVMISNLGDDVILSAELPCHDFKGIGTIEENQAVCHLPKVMLLPSPSVAFGGKDALVVLPRQLSPGSGLRSLGLVGEVALTPVSALSWSALEFNSTFMGVRDQYPC